MPHNDVIIRAAIEAHSEIGEINLHNGTLACSEQNSLSGYQAIVDAT